MFKFQKIVKLGMVVKTRRIGRVELYRLNMESQMVKKLIELDLNNS